MKKVRYVIINQSFSRCSTNSIKQFSRIAIERSAEKQANYAARIGTYDANQLVFVDESAVDRRTTYHGQAWAICG